MTDWFTYWLRLEMRRRGLSLRELAALSGVDHGSISRLFGGERTPHLDTAQKLAGALGYSLTIVPGPPDYYR